MIQWVIDAACRSAADEAAGGDGRCAHRCRGQRSALAGTLAGGDDARRSLSGTDRIAEVAQARGWDGRTVVVNVQGDSRSCRRI